VQAEEHVLYHVFRAGLVAHQQLCQPHQAERVGAVQVTDKIMEIIAR